MRVRLGEDEWYPVLTPERREDWMNDKYWDSCSTEVPDELVERWDKAAAEMHAACAALREYYK